MVGSAFQPDTEYALHVILLEMALDHVARSLVAVKVAVEFAFEELAFATCSEIPNLQFGVPDKSLAILGSWDSPEVRARTAPVGNDDRHNNDRPNESAYLVDTCTDLEDTIDWTRKFDRSKDPFANFLIQRV